MTWSAPIAFAFSALASSPTVVMTVQPMAFAILIATDPMPEPAACTRIVSPGFSLALSNSMCSVVPKAIGAQAASRSETTSGTGTTRRAGMLIRSRAKPSIWKPSTPATFSHKLSRPSRQFAHLPQVIAPYITTFWPRLNCVTPRPAAAICPEAPEIEVVEANGLDADLDFVFARRGRLGHFGQFELAVADQSQCAHGRIRRTGGQTGSTPTTSETFCPPKPKELEIACLSLASRALFGTTSSGIAGSGRS